MTEIKLVLTDIDGTLVWHGQHNPSEAVKRAMSDVQNAGIELIAATGRPYEMAQPLFIQLGFRDLGIFDAGASIRRIETGELVWSNWLDDSRLRHIASILLPYAIAIDLYPTFREIPPSEVNLDATIEPAPYVFALIQNSDKQHIIQQLAGIPNITHHISPERKDKPGICDIQVTDINADKFHAVNALRKLVRSEKSETLAIGDSTNDLPLFRNAGIKVAMGNAMEELKREADYVVSDVDHDGFAEAMRRFVLNRFEFMPQVKK